MKVIDTISVNPSKTAMGHVDAGKGTNLFRSHIIGEESPTPSINTTDILFPTVSKGMSEYRKYALPLRTIFATILIVTGITLLEMPVGLHSVGFAICTLCFGTFLALGLFTRPTMLGASIFYCISGALGIRHGMPDVSVFSLMFGALLFAVIGSGKYSCDTLIRTAILRHIKRSERKRKENVMSYKAFHQVKI